MSVDFADEIKGFEQSLREKRELLDRLEKKRDAHTVQTKKARAALEDLRAVVRGETPPSQRGKTSSVRGVEAVPVNKDTNRPARGARRQQILDICRKVGASGDIFRTADVLNILRKVEDDVSTGMRSYTYTVMNTFEDEGLIEKQGRGKWLWKG